MRTQDWKWASNIAQQEFTSKNENYKDTLDHYKDTLDHPSGNEKIVDVCKKFPISLFQNNSVYQGKSRSLL